MQQRGYRLCGTKFTVYRGLYAEQLFLASTRRYFTRFSLPPLLLSYSFRCIIASLRIESTPLLSLSLSIAILNPFSSPEDEDWIGRVSSVELSGEEERERKNVCERNLGNVASVRSRLFFWSEKSRIYTRNLSIQEFWRNCPFVIIKKMWICNHSVTLSRNFISYKFVFRKAKNWTLKKRRIAILFSRNLSEERQAR